MKYLETLGSPFMAHYARRLADLINEQSTQLLKEFNISVPASAISTLQFLDTNENVTVADLAKALGVTHQMATQRINTLEKLSLVIRCSVPNDQRAKLIKTSIKGQKEIHLLQPFMQKMKLLFEALENELGNQLSQTMYQAEVSLRNQPLRARLSVLDTEDYNEQ